MAVSRARRVGVFGGAFDPPHAAHVALARAAIGQLGLDELRIVPTGQAWHRERSLSQAQHRLEMARLAFSDLTGVLVDDREMLRAGDSYTVDTLRELKRELPDAELYLLIGEDQAASFGRWREADEIGRLAHIFIARRPGGKRLSGTFRSENPALADAGTVQMPEMDVSATAIRARVAAAKPPGDALPPGVARYIDRHQLYSGRQPAPNDH